MTRRQKVYRLDKGEIPNLEVLTPKVRRKVMRAGVRIVALKTRTLIPDSGRAHKKKLSKSITYGTKDRGYSGYVKSKSPYAHLVHDGVAPHDIRPRQAQALNLGGAVRKTVRHPGYAGNPFLDKAAEQTKGEMERTMREKMDEVLNEEL
jgi:HK97 gp10 family phage protein